MMSGHIVRQLCDLETMIPDDEFHVCVLHHKLFPPPSPCCQFTTSKGIHIHGTLGVSTSETSILAAKKLPM